MVFFWKLYLFRVINLRLGSGHGSMSEETEIKYSKAMIGKYDGVKHPQYGTHQSLETKKNNLVRKRKNMLEIETLF